jgi:hypothetical protein
MALDNAIFETIRESALLKLKGGLALKKDQIDNNLVAWVARYDLFVAFWKEDGNDHPLVIRAPLDLDRDLHGNAVYVDDRATALALYAACRADDNGAPPPPIRLFVGRRASEGNILHAGTAALH